MCGFCVDELWELDEKAKEMANSFQGRILSKLVEREEEKVALENENNERRLEARRARLIQNEICDEEEAQQYIKDPFHALPSPINERHMEFVARERKKEREDEEKTEMEKARSIYKDSWLIQKEKEMYDLVEKKNNTVDIEMKSTLEGLILISENKIKMFHEKSGTPSRVGLHERKKMCLVLGRARHKRNSQLISPLATPRGNIDTAQNAILDPKTRMGTVTESRDAARKQYARESNVLCSAQNTLLESNVVRSAEDTLLESKV